MSHNLNFWPLQKLGETNQYFMYPKYPELISSIKAKLEMAKKKNPFEM